MEINLHPIFLFMGIPLLIFIVILAFSIKALNRGNGRKYIILSAILTSILIVFIAYFSFVLDQYAGIGAYKLYYLFFVFIISILVSTIWRKKLKAYSIILGPLVFTILYFSVYAYNPSERILRSIQLQLKPGSEASLINDILKASYSNTGFKLPRIEKEKSRIHISPLSQSPGGNCTALIFSIKDGIIIDSLFSLD